jgi:predicted transcriptional regulator
LTLSEVIDDGFLARYRALLDAEDAAFDELEHAFEDGDREHFAQDLDAWRSAVERKLNYLHRLGVVEAPTIRA